MTRTHQQTHEAGRHLAAAEALIRGYSAELVTPQTYIRVNGVKAQVQVAAKGAWQLADVDHYVAADISVNVLVDMTEGRRDIYICPGSELREGVRQRHAQFLANHAGTRPRNPDSKHSAISPTQVLQWRDNWPLFKVLANQS